MQVTDIENMLKIIFTLLFFVSINAQAGIVYNAIKATPQVAMSRDSTGVTSCGVRVMTLVEVGDETTWHDFSGSVYRDGIFGLWKAGSYRYATAKLLKKIPAPGTSIRLPAPTGFWIAEAGASSAASMQKVIPAEDKGFILGDADVVNTMNTVLAIAKGSPIQFAMQYKDEKVERIVSFSAPLNDADYSTLLRCFEGLQAGIASDNPGIDKE